MFLDRYIDHNSGNILNTDGWPAYYALDWRKMGYYWRKNIHEGAPVLDKNGKWGYVGGRKLKPMVANLF